MRQHPTAVIHAATRIAEDVSVGPYAVIEDGVELGSGCLIREHAVIRAGTVLGPGCVVDAHAVIGGLPQDTSFNPATPSGVRAGAGVMFREGVTVNRATAEGAFTEIGDGALLMANSHVGHDCRVGAHVILANGVLLAGKVTVGEHAFIGGNAAVHQYCRVGASAMVSGLARVSQDAPPFCIVAERNGLIGLNLIGLQRRGVERAAIRELKKLFQMVFHFDGRPRILADGALRDGLAATAEGRHFLECIAAESKRGTMRPRRQSTE
jgi:UDP-N-acetylglucosamine acyltransferase